MELQAVWFFLWGLLWAVYFMTDGFDLGVGTLLPFLAKGDRERRVLYASMGPLWDGNEVWLITAGGVTFAAFPKLYAVMFSSLYSPLMLILFALIIRGVSFEFRDKSESRLWRGLWDMCMFLGSFLPALLFGVAFANIFRGLPIDSEGIYKGDLVTLLNPYGLLGGVLFVLLFLVHGSLWAAIKSEGNLHRKALSAAKVLWFLLLVAAVTFLVSSAFATKLYANYTAHPGLFAEIAITVLALLGTRFFLARENLWNAWFCSAATIVGATFFGVIGLFPKMFPSSINPDFSLTAYNSSSSPLTLKIMLIVVVIFVPLVLAYQAWAYFLFRGKVTEESLEGY